MQDSPSHGVYFANTTLTLILIMKKVYLFWAFAAAVALTACNKDDDNYVDLSQLAGTWVYYNHDPNFSADGSVAYSFDGEGGYWKFVHDALANTVAVHRGTYEIAGTEESKRITLRDGEGGCDGEYFFLWLTSRSMKWREAVYGARPRVERFERVNRYVLPKIYDDSAVLTGVWKGECVITLADGSKRTEGVLLALYDNGKYLCQSQSIACVARVIGGGNYMVSGDKLRFISETLLNCMIDWTSLPPILLDGEYTFSMQSGCLNFCAKKGDEHFEYRLSRFIEGLE